MKKKHKIVLIETDKHAVDFPKLLSIRTNSKGKLLQSHGVLSDAYIRHLYILSDDKIKEGDWVMNNNTNNIAQYTGHGSMEWWKKIIATTNTELKWEFKGVQMSRMMNYPKISELFIKIYIAEYNKGNVIEEVELEYDSEEKPAWSGMWVDTLKLREDNTVIIDLVEEKKYTKDEVLNILHNWENYSIDVRKQSTINFELEEWFNKNYKYGK